MKSKINGFTLVELLAVILVLGIIIAIVGVSVSSVIKNSEQKGYDLQVEGIIKAAKEWTLENTDKLPEWDGINYPIPTQVTINELIASGKLTEKPKNPKTNKAIEGFVEIKCVESNSCASYYFSFIDVS